jgi:hypothetical protein
MGLLFDPQSSRRRVVCALILTAVAAGHGRVVVVPPDLGEAIACFEAVWRFLTETSGVLITDNVERRS